jgi:hypothetical protein
VDIHSVAGRASREGRALLLVILGPELTAGQLSVIHDVATLAWMWFEALHYQTVTGIHDLEDDDEVILAARPAETDALGPAIRGKRVEDVRRVG